MNTKLVSIFAVAGVVAAGSSAYAINTQAVQSGTISEVGTTQLDLTKSELTILPPDAVDNADTPDGDSDSNSSDSDAPVSNLPIVTVGPSDEDLTDSEIPALPAEKKRAPVAEPSDSAGPVLPPPPPGYKPGSEDEDDDESQDEEDANDDHEDSQDGQHSWENDDD